MNTCQQEPIGLLESRKRLTSVKDWIRESKDTIYHRKHNTYSSIFLNKGTCNIKFIFISYQVSLNFTLLDKAYYFSLSLVYTWERTKDGTGKIRQFFSKGAPCVFPFKRQGKTYEQGQCMQKSFTGDTRKYGICSTKYHEIQKSVEEEMGICDRDLGKHTCHIVQWRSWEKIKRAWRDVVVLTDFKSLTKLSTISVKYIIQNVCRVRQSCLKIFEGRGDVILHLQLRHWIWKLFCTILVSAYNVDNLLFRKLIC